MTLYQYFYLLRIRIDKNFSFKKKPPIVEYFQKEGFVEYVQSTDEYLVSEKGKAELVNQLYLRIKIWIPIAISLVALIRTFL